MCIFTPLQDRTHNMVHVFNNLFNKMYHYFLQREMYGEYHAKPMDIHLVLLALWITFSDRVSCSGGILIIIAENVCVWGRGLGWRRVGWKWKNGNKTQVTFVHEIHFSLSFCCLCFLPKAWIDTARRIKLSLVLDEHKNIALNAKFTHI